MAADKTSEQESTEATDRHLTEAVEAVGETATGFPVVGIGASAGGLAAFEAFFSAIPADAQMGMAFVLVQHLAPDHKSILSDLVKRYTRMDVFEVEDGMRVAPNCAYIIPPNRDMAFLHGALQLLEPAAPRGQRLPIDFFFRSLAQDQRERAVCIVLSGTGSDGTLGLRAVKGEGGMVMAQNPESTEYDGMPLSAIGTGLVDYVLPPAEMPAQLIAYAAHAGGPPRPSVPPSNKQEEHLKKVFVLLRAQTGRDFSQYKENTIRRRVERRMAVHQIDHLGEYVRYLQATAAEVDALFRDLLIGVTNFFRDPEAFAALETQIIPRLFVDKPPGATIRVWVPGCSTGEEAYSIAILLREHLDALNRSFKLQLFATDIDPRALETARAATYPASIAADLTPERLARHFSELGSGNYRVHKSIRDFLILSEQDVTKDPPFSRLDLISCRNLLIYMGPELQRRLIPLFHYALNPEGSLFLGTSESVGEFAALFSITESKAKIYQRKEDVYGAARPPLGKVRSMPPESGDPIGHSRRGSGELKAPFRELTERALLEEAQVCALVDQHGELLYLHGHTGQWLEPAPGDAGVNILKMAREGLRYDLAAALHKAVAAKERVSRPGLRVKTNGGFTAVNLTVRPVSGGAAAGDRPFFLVIFEKVLPPLPGVAEKAVPPRAGDDANAPRADDARVLALKQELSAKEEYLHATQEEMQTANEELKSSNEELQSTNEELQSTNEELETSKEELQSVNEELATVNAELQNKVTDLSRVNNDMTNLLAGTGIGTLFVDHQMCIRRFTPAVTPVLNLIPTDVGRPLGHTVSNLLGYDRLVSDVQSVLDTLQSKEVEVQTDIGAWYLLRTTPYRTSENVVEGAVITFTEVTAIKNAQAAMKEATTMRTLAGTVRDARDAIIVHDLDGRIQVWNPGALRMYGFSEAEALGMNIRALSPEKRRDEALAVIQRLSHAEILEPYRAERLTKNGDIVQVTMTATALVNAAGVVYAVSTLERGVLK